MRRLDVVLEPTKDKVLEAASKPIIDALRDSALKRAAGVNFYNTSKFTMSSLLADADGIRENLTQYVTSFCPDVADTLAEIRELEAGIAEKMQGILEGE